MLPGPKDLTIQQGDDYTFVFRVRSKVWDVDSASYIPGDYVDLSGQTGAAEIRASSTSPDVLASFTVTIDPDQADPAKTGMVTMTLAHDATATLPVTGGVWDVQLTSSTGYISTYLSGKVIVLPEVTRAS